MGVLLRVLGLQALAALVGTMPARAARTLTLVMLVGANLFPLVALLQGAWQAGDVLVTYWLENVAVGIWQLVKLATAQGPNPVPADASGAAVPPGSIPATLNGRPIQLSASVARLVVSGFFAVHYGMFTLVHGVFTFMLAHRSGTSGSVRGFAVVFLVLLLSHGLSTAIYWFARGERHTQGLAATMKEPYGRIVVLHLAVLGSSFLLLGATSTQGPVGTDPGALTPTPSVLPGVLLIALKTTLDAGLHLRTHRSSATVPATVVAPSATA